VVKALGTIYVERKEIRHGTIDSMSREEVERKLNEIKSLYGGPPPQAILGCGSPKDITMEK
jgi:CRISPR/Cas system-associated exonuclease Cas4 (RecB family)